MSDKSIKHRFLDKIFYKVSYDMTSIIKGTVYAFEVSSCESDSIFFKTENFKFYEKDIGFSVFASLEDAIEFRIFCLDLIIKKYGSLKEYNAYRLKLYYDSYEKWNADGIFGQFPIKPKKLKVDYELI